ncbi:hypothetical protein RI129_002247 [Pyrocoelia pectoralis]|uniref:ornithine decarboxylase n=1 Tax=Pyrocoelia pectoralis TaxID=417401 RepID=A0AAN7VFM4_9COLE
MNFENNSQNVEVYDNIDITRIIAEKIQQRKKSAPFYVCDLGEIFKKYLLWTSSLPRIKPFYAVKANCSPNVLKTLADLGVNFDCASTNEIHKVLSFGVHSSRIIYAHTVKAPESIQYANEVDVKLMTFDNAEELQKMKKLCPNVRATLRIKSDAKKALVKYGSKFGCDVETEAATLIHLARALDVDLVGVSFHVGSECEDLEAFDKAIKLAHTVFQLAKLQGYSFSILDIGGGFPGNNNELFKKIARQINDALDYYFPNESVQVIAEPGCFFVNSSSILACNVLSKKFGVNSKWIYYINDGLFGSFNRDYFFNVPITVYPLKKYPKSEVYSSTIFGVTCASDDKLCSDVSLPVLEIGDWLLFDNKGAYCLSSCTSFNGFCAPDVCYIIDL